MQKKTRNTNTHLYLSCHFFCFALYSLLCATFCQHSTAQSLPHPSTNLRERIIPFTNIEGNKNLYTFDTLSIVPNSVRLWLMPNHIALDTNCYHIDHITATIHLKKSKELIISNNKTALSISKQESKDSLSQQNLAFKIQYRVFPFSLSRPRFNKDIGQIQNPKKDPIANYYNYETTKNINDRLFDSNAMNYNGSIGRGLSFGNTQDLVVNSNFNLQMAGKIAGDIEVLAAMTDNNIPFQPEGNTQQLQSFDRIFIQLKRKNASLLLGDYNLKRPDTYFMNFTRRLQGLQFEYNYPQNPTNKNAKYGKSGTALAIAKGTYQRATITPIEGNQGPYKLIGANGETFIIILSASERLFLDGKLLTRGSDADYIIDYNTAEVTFTSKKIITKDQRITIEYEYADRYYLRSNIYAYTYYNTPKWNFKADVFSEQDAKNQPLTNGILSDNNKLQLRNAGNDTDKMIAQSADSIAYSTERILYQLLNDTTVAQQLYDSIYVYSTDPQKAHYSLIFSYVGAQKGNYKVASNIANGRVYRWIAPDSINHTPQGEYEPIVRLVAPLTRQMASLNATYLYHKNGKMSAEIALANNDPNTFSSIDNQNNKGIALQINASQIIKLKQSQQTKIPNSNTQKGLTQANDTILQPSSAQLLFAFNYEFVQATFKPLEPYRNIEFGRDWSLNINPNNPNTINTNTNNLALNNEHIGMASVQYTNTKKTNLSYQINTLWRGQGQYKGIKQIWRGNTNSKNGITCNWQLSYLDAQNDTLYRSKFWRPNIDISKLFKNKKNKIYQVSLKWIAEQNRIKSSQSDTLQRASFAFHQTNFSLQTGDSTQNNYTLNISQRYDYAAQLNQLLLANHALNLSISGGIRTNIKQQLTWAANYRQLSVVDTLISIAKKNNNSLLAEINYNGTIYRDLLRISTQYQIGQGQKQRTEIYYQKVPNGTGNIIWRDNNNDGIEQPDEFEIANNNDLILANYIQIALPTTEYQATNIVQWVQTIQLQPKNLWKNPNSWQRLVALLSWQSNLTTRRETLANAKLNNFIPLTPIDSSHIVGENTQMRHSLFINRNQAKWETNLYYALNTNTNLLIAGTDSRFKREWGAMIKLGLNNKFTANINANWGNNKQISQAFALRNFNIYFWSIEPALTFMPNKFTRFIGTYKYKSAHNQAEQPTKPANIQQLSIDLRYGTATQSTITAKLSYTMVAYQGNKQSTAAYTLLDGFQPGNNFQWTINFDTRLSGGLQLNLGYEGRKNNDNAIIHTGRTSLRAVF